MKRRLFSGTALLAVRGNPQTAFVTYFWAETHPRWVINKPNRL
jgi:hypothetical protein